MTFTIKQGKSLHPLKGKTRFDKADQLRLNGYMDTLIACMHEDAKGLKKFSKFRKHLTEAKREHKQNRNNLFQEINN